MSNQAIPARSPPRISGGRMRPMVLPLTRTSHAQPPTLLVVSRHGLVGADNLGCRGH